MDKREKPIQKGKLRLEAISEYRSEIYGISIFWISLFHMSEHTKFEIFDGIPVLHYLQEVVKRGNMGVDVFLFISGICLYFSFVKNQDILAFMKKRVSRIMYPLLFTSVPLWLAYLVFHKITICCLFCCRLLNLSLGTGFFLLFSRTLCITLCCALCRLSN